MLRPIALIAVLSIVLSRPAAGQTPQLQSPSANETIAEYLRAVEAARRECVTKLEAAEKEAISGGDRDDAAQIQAAIAAVDGHRAADVFDPFAALNHQIADTRWANRDNIRLWSTFEKDHTLRNTKGEAGRWAVVSPNTVASTTGNKYVYLWVFDETGQTCTLQRFNHDANHSRSYVKQSGAAGDR